LVLRDTWQKVAAKVLRIAEARPSILPSSLKSLQIEYSRTDTISLDVDVIELFSAWVTELRIHVYERTALSLDGYALNRLNRWGSQLKTFGIVDHHYSTYYSSIALWNLRPLIHSAFPMVECLEVDVEVGFSFKGCVYSRLRELNIRVYAHQPITDILDSLICFIADGRAPRLETLIVNSFITYLDIRIGVSPGGARARFISTMELFFDKIQEDRCAIRTSQGSVEPRGERVPRENEHIIICTRPKKLLRAQQ
jgi:hypothetical protein